MVLFAHLQDEYQLLVSHNGVLGRLAVDLRQFACRVEATGQTLNVVHGLADFPTYGLKIGFRQVVHQHRIDAGVHGREPHIVASSAIIAFPVDVRENGIQKLEFLNLYILEPHFIAVILQQDVPFFVVAEVGPVLIF